ncbi:hypothetical protein ACWDUL_20955 [Nocardia niigatensis]
MDIAGLDKHLAQSLIATGLSNIVADAVIPLAAVADQAGLSLAELDQILRGNRGVEVDVLIRLAAALDFDARQFLNDVQQQFLQAAAEMTRGHHA